MVTNNISILYKEHNSMIKSFLIGSDSNLFWQLEWFLENYKKHNDTPLIFADFGLTSEEREWIETQVDEVITIPSTEMKSWVLKPAAMIEAAKISRYTCWMDIDCEVLGDISGIFDEIVEGKLTIAEDRPWIRRKRQHWHNTGVVAFKDVPPILTAWYEKCSLNNMNGQPDQDVLHYMTLDPKVKMATIKNMSPKYNVTRIQVLDGEDVKDKLVMHWTGEKGNEVIRRKMSKRRINVVGNGPLAELWKKDEERTGKTVICNLPPFEIDPSEVWATVMVDFKMMKALTQQEINLDQYQWVLGARPQKWMYAQQDFYLKYSHNIRQFYTVLPKYVHNYTDFNCGHMAVHYVCNALKASEVHLYGFDSLFERHIKSSTDNHLASDKSDLNTHRLIEKWRPIWQNIFLEFPDITFVLHHDHGNIKFSVPKNVIIMNHEK